MENHNIKQAVMRGTTNPCPLLPPSEWYWLVNASPLSYGRW